MLNNVVVAGFTVKRLAYIGASAGMFYLTFPIDVIEVLINTMPSGRLPYL